jgi:branched-subunit amino acid ABC-type transport system permease component
MIGALVFFALSFQLVPTWFDADPLLFVEHLARLALAALAALAVHRLLLRLLIRS